MFNVNKSKNKGFTLIELMVVIAVIAILASIALFGLRQAQASARDTSRIQIMSSVRAQLETYYGANNTYPTGAGVKFKDALNTIGYNIVGLQDPGCGSGVIAYAYVASTDWTPAAVGGCTFGSAVSYVYSSGAAGSYTLTLNKEGGGSKQFTNPL